MPDKKFANLHYPGIRPNPKEGESSLTEVALRRFSEQIQCLGEDLQGELFRGSALVTPASPLGVLVAQKLLLFGLGRVGVLGDQNDSGTHGLTTVNQPGAGTVLKLLPQWAKAQTPWAMFESFSQLSPEREFEDIAPGFQLLIDTGGPESWEKIQAQARVCDLPLIVGWSTARQGFAAVVPDSKSAAMNKLQERMKTFKSEPPQPGLLFPMLDLVANRVLTMAFEAVLERSTLKPRFERMSATASPWSWVPEDLA